MAALALALFVLYASLAFGGRMFIQVRRTGSTGFRGISGRAGSLEWLGGVLLVVAVVLSLAAPVLDLTGTFGRFTLLEGPVGRTLGIALYGLGLVGTLVAQGTMGSSWRIGVDASEETDLVTTGPFSLVRNPIFTAMTSTFLGLTLLVPNIVSLAGFLTLVVALELQVRFVEEPYLLRTHGDDYAGYANRVGRFLPGIGRLGTGRVRHDA